MSVSDILACLYGDDEWLPLVNAGQDTRNRLFFSKGHASAALYSALALAGYVDPVKLLEGFGRDGSIFTTHVNHKVHGVEFSTGSLGHALGVSVGSALGGRRKHLDYRVFAILSDGELDEGSNWESILAAAHLRLGNLTVVVDCNGIQSFGRTTEVMNLEPLAAKFEAFNWRVRDVDGHDIDALSHALRESHDRPDIPMCILARTVKGKGVSFMEDDLAWHYRSPSSREVELAHAEILAEETIA